MMKGLSIERIFAKSDYRKLSVFEFKVPAAIDQTIEKNIPELKITSLITQEVVFPVLYKFSSFRKLQRIMAYVAQFISNNRKNSRKNYNSIKSEEMTESLTILIKLVQMRSFRRI